MKDQDCKKTKTLIVRVSEAEMKTIRMYADRMGMTISRYIRLRALFG